MPAKKEYFLQELKKYCKFQITEKGKVDIEEIYKNDENEEIFYKAPLNNQQKIENLIPEVYNTIKDNYGGVLLKEIGDYVLKNGGLTNQKNGTPLSPKTINVYVSKGVINIYGKINTPGPQGYRKVILLFYDRDTSSYKVPTKEQIEARKKIIEKWYQDKATAKVFFELHEGYVNGAYSKEDIIEYYKSESENPTSKYWQCQREIEEKIGCFLKKTVLKLYKDEKDEEFNF